MHHAAAAELEPRTVGARDVELGRGLGEREVAGPEAALHLGAEEGLDELVDGAGEVAHRDALVDHQAFDLVEGGQVGCIGGVGAERAPRSDDVDRRLLVLHGADLHRRGVAAKHHFLGLAEVHEDGVEAAAGGMPVGDVERLEVVPGGLDLGTFRHGEAHADEHVFETVAGLGDQVGVTAAELTANLGEVEPLVFELSGAGCGLELGAASGEGRLDADTGLVDGLPGLGALVGLEGAELLLGQVDGRLLAQVVALACAQLVERGHGRNRSLGFGDQIVVSTHRWSA